MRHTCQLIRKNAFFVCVATLLFSVVYAPLPLTGENSPPSFTETAKKAIPSVVSIKVQQTEMTSPKSPFHPDDPFDFFFRSPFFRHSPRSPYPPTREKISQGSGFLVSEDGYLLTNAHVVKNASKIFVTLYDQREFEGTVIGMDENTDVAIVKIEEQNLPYLKLGDSEALEVGQWVIAVGNPLGLQASVTAGIVSAKGRANLDIANIEDFIQTDAAINRGNSGGPLLNQRGEVIGMNTAIITNHINGGYMGIGFAIPSNMASHVMEQLIDSGSVSRGFIGVSLQGLDQNLANALEIDTIEGALVVDVTPNSPAESAGLEQGDVIVAYNGKKVRTIASLRNAVALMKPGTQVTLEIVRHGKTQTLSLRLATYPTDHKFAKYQEDRLGIEVEETKEGVVIRSVKPGTPASWVGLRKGTLILEVNRQKTETAQEYREALASAESGTPILLLIKQGEVKQFVSIQVH